MLKVETAPNGRNYIVGNTYPVKEVLRAEGLTWDPQRKGWWTLNAAKAASLVEELQDKATSTGPNYVVRASSSGKPPLKKRCWECGCQFTYADAKRGGGDWNDSYCGC